MIAQMRVFLTVFLLVLTSCNDGDPIQIDIPNLKEPEVTLGQNKVFIELTFENLNIDDYYIIPIPEYKDSFVEVMPSIESGTRMLATISISDILDDELLLLPPQKLPDGRNLPGVSQGFLPSIAFQIPVLGDTTFYLGDKFFGFFAPFDNGLDTDTIVTARFYNNGNTRLGNISIIGANNTDSRGVLLLLDLNNMVKSRLRKIQRKFNKGLK